MSNIVKMTSEQTADLKGGAGPLAHGPSFQNQLCLLSIAALMGENIQKCGGSDVLERV